MPDLPHSIPELVDELAAMPGVIAVVLGGSRTLGSRNSLGNRSQPAGRRTSY